MKYIIKFEMLENNLVKVIYSDKSEEVISDKQFNQYSKEGKIKMAFIIP